MPLCQMKRITDTRLVHQICSLAGKLVHCHTVALEFRQDRIFDANHSFFFFFCCNCFNNRLLTKTVWKSLKGKSFKKLLKDSILSNTLNWMENNWNKSKRHRTAEMFWRSEAAAGVRNWGGHSSSELHQHYWTWKHSPTHFAVVIKIL